MLTSLPPTATDPPNADEAADVAVVLAHEAGEAAARADVVAAAARVPAAARPRASRALPSSRSSAWRPRRPSVRTWPKRWPPSPAPAAPPRPVAARTATRAPMVCSKEWSTPARRPCRLCRLALARDCSVSRMGAFHVGTRSTLTIWGNVGLRVAPVLRQITSRHARMTHKEMRRTYSRARSRDY